MYTHTLILGGCVCCTEHNYNARSRDLMCVHRVYQTRISSTDLSRPSCALCALSNQYR